MLNLRSDRGVACTAHSDTAHSDTAHSDTAHSDTAHSDRLAARPYPNPYLSPCPAHIESIRTTQERARYLRTSVDCHVHKVGQPVDETGKTIYPLWRRQRSRLSRRASTAVENRAAMWTSGG